MVNVDLYSALSWSHH